MSIYNDPQIKKLFFESAEKYLQEINDNLLSLEATPETKELVETIFRNFHSLKSESLAMGYAKLSDLCHKLEDLFAILKEGKQTLDENGFSEIFQIVDFINADVEILKKSDTEKETDSAKQKVDQILKSNLMVSQKDKLQVDTSNLQAEIKRPNLENIKVSLRVLDHLMNIVEELTIEKMRFAEIVNNKEYLKLQEIAEKFDFLISDLQYYVTQARLTPIDDIFQNLPRVIRDLTQKLNKKVNVKLDLGNLKVDRFIGETIYEPVLHIIRNALDHGIENPEERTKSGKEAEGSLEVKAYSDKGLAVIEINDDGRGFDIETARKRLNEKGVKEIEKLDDSAVIDLLFEGGISTASKLTDVSGRGVGLNIVGEVMDRVGGRVRVDTKKGKGTRFILEFPFTLAIIEVILVKVKKDVFAIPVTNIVKTLRVKKEDIQKAADTDVFLFNKEEVMMIYLTDLFKKEKTIYNDDLDVVIVNTGKNKLGFVVDQVMELEEIIVKPLAMEAEKTYFAGVTILGNDKTVLVIDVAKLIEQFSRN
ncbi:hypothetical protein A2X44_04135 [candidate division CPR3 bacterium GWF2_35_18]|uniref:Chemotaxis protein CheA n=1 Tax=candidate division CPR3 bacterium GW2011_GWF2_35_18 TaxID=1618350 RepID=A0A0G0BZM1_UNCC3|nr:MAG: Two-component system, chemotaxis family, sensor kinase CheA [candidate division CPR3 bacterium GW2011_GWF2_35_18]OGB62544.1 MAG: hypothetical protein A2X44_04135 [candidate division CPR3 bacterium GWF2_35_18]OGB65795.1 MAG: hypothetical protein A2250_01385 [candidate division CPR3 bacterium RIFOXYA2_FULL_35_13]OGB77368.1 MAG: hypothetical protein A2476_03825 [candidate division CPR3 bacterium RIFOXYC2_FULL_35_7]OGB79287.1 MAG: hypothetical protein A2296_03925 [candidate division CPR3 ba